MPIYEYECDCGTEFTRYLPAAQYLDPQICECGARAQKVIRSVPMAFIQPDCHYESPIDGRPITSWAQRKEDLARSGCVEYDPQQRVAYDRRVKEEADHLEKAMDETIDREIATMPTRKREILENEMQAGVNLETIRTTPMESANV